MLHFICNLRIHPANVVPAKAETTHSQRINWAKGKVDKQIKTFQELRNQEIEFSDSLNKLVGQRYNLNDPDYIELRPDLDALIETLITAGQVFFNNKPTVEGAKTLEKACNSAINAASIKFAPFKGINSFYNDLHPFLQSVLNCCKMLVGILAAVTLVTDKASQLSAQA